MTCTGNCWRMGECDCRKPSVTISVVIPTVSRPSLTDAILSASAADELIVIPDNTGDWGNTPRNIGIDMASSSHIAFLDDDDVYTPGAIEAIKAHAHPSRMTLFRMRDGDTLYWRSKELAQGNIGTPCIVVPNIPDKLGSWGSRYEGDYDFACSTASRMGDPVWVDHVVCVVRP